jgi:hypothetical protein
VIQALRTFVSTLLLGFTAASAAPLGSLFTYQGRLESSGAPADGVYDLRFTLCDSESLGSVVSSTDCVDNVDVVDGLFTVMLDFGPGAFDGQARWLEIEVRPDAAPIDCSGGGFTLLSPRQPLTATPYALQTRGFHVDDTGRVGLGTNAPDSELHIDGSDSSDVSVHIHHPGATTGDIYIGSPVGGIGFTAFAPTNGHKREVRFHDDGLHLAVAADSGAAGTDLFINEAGDVGIGTATPTNGRVDINAGNQRCIYGSNNSSFFAAATFKNFSIGPAGVFDGNVAVFGSLSKSGGSFRIDHPLDPANQYLYHSFVESPDMKNLYDGVVVTDGHGYATITMPDWFEPLNRDFRYQLTVIDESDADDFVLAKIVREIADRRFTIRSSRRGVKVSWQVTEKQASQVEAQTSSRSEP